MRRMGLARTALAVVIAAVGFVPLPAHAVNRCKVATIGSGAFFCEFYADGPIEYTAASVSGWRIDRLIKQKNDGTLVWKKLVGQDAVDEGLPPIVGGIDKGVIPAEEGWRIRVQVLVSVDRQPMLPPPYNVRAYRNGYVEAVSSKS